MIFLSELTGLLNVSHGLLSNAAFTSKQKTKQDEILLLQLDVRKVIKRYGF